MTSFSLRYNPLPQSNTIEQPLLKVRHLGHPAPPASNKAHLLAKTPQPPPPIICEGRIGQVAPNKYIWSCAFHWNLSSIPPVNTPLLHNPFRHCIQSLWLGLWVGVHFLFAVCGALRLKQRSFDKVKGSGFLRLIPSKMCWKLSQFASFQKTFCEAFTRSCVK